MDAVRFILKPFASLRLTVILLAMSMVVIVAGTLAQIDAGIWEVQKQFFHSWFCWIHLGLVLPRTATGQFLIPGAIPFVGGYFLITALLVNLLAAHLVRFKLRWNRSGIILAHLGLILLLVGEMFTSLFATEGQMILNPGQALNYAQDIRAVELAVTDSSPADHENVTVIPAKLLSRDGTVIKDAKLPFEIKVDAYYPNSQPLGPFQDGPKADARVNAGTEIGRRIVPVPVLTGVGPQAERVDMPSAILTLKRDQKPLGTWLVSFWSNRPQTVTLPDGRAYDIDLRFKRVYKPYTIQLLKFSHDKYVGTELEKNFSSRVRFVDPSHGVDREALIWMNHPLRYGFETIYQQSFGKDESGNDTGSTTLQIVKNRGNWLPYVALGIAIVGLVIQFGKHLITFLSRELSRDPLADLPATAGRGRAAPEPGSRLPALAMLIPGAGAALIALIGLLIAFSVGWENKAGAFDFNGFGKLPVSYDGRTMPVETLARTSLKIIHGSEDLAVKGTDIPPDQWLLDLMTRPDTANDEEVFRIDNPDVRSSIGLPTDRKFFSMSEILAHKDKLQPQMDKVFKSQDEEGPSDLVSTQFRELGTHLMLYLKLQGVTNLYLVPPLGKGQQWITWGEASQLARDTGEARPGLTELATLLDSYIKNKPDEFNATLADYHGLLDRSLPKQGKVEFESAYERVNPFYVSLILYVAVALVAFGSWLLWHRPLTAVAWSMLVGTFVIHSFGLAARIYISGRPPVINLYSSAVFIPWAAVAFCIVIELLHRNSVGNLVAAVMGFSSLLIAQALGAEGDTMGQLRAVLDTNFWLATHVVVVTLGYAATFLAGMLAAVYILLGVTSTKLDDEFRKSMKSVVYGIVCFGLLFSFVGTILGGIWADQSWGRFWGWDPKENGAILIVLWNAIVLHARWGGLVRERGMMALAVFGNVVTSWSWFGTNLLGIGLHSYGFMHGAAANLAAFCVSQLTIIGISLIPLRYWRSFSEPTGFPMASTRKLPVPTPAPA